MKTSPFLSRIAFLLVLGLSFFATGKAAAAVSVKVLILNSYHLGYLWSDGEVAGIENTIKRVLPDAYIAIEYLDTKRVSSEKSSENLFALFRDKYQGWRFDLIVSVDDNAFTFLKKFRRQLFGEVPVVFCGVNYFKPEMLHGLEKATGVTEIHRIADNVRLMQSLHPGLKKVTVVTDVTVSGQISLQEVKDAIPRFSERLEFEFLEGLPLPELERRLSRLSSGSAVFLLNYFRDQAGNYYEPEMVMPRISTASPVPVYCFSEFYLNHGVTGGIINEGYLHGALAGKIALRVLGGEDPSQMPVVEGPMNPVFDYRQMQRFGLNISALPLDATILNHKEKDRKDILVLHSYDPEFSWTTNVNRGLRDVLRQRRDLGELFVEYMDTKRIFTKRYLNQLYELFRLKYANRSLDLVITTDDNAFDFVREFKTNLFKETPVVFCGVNYMENPDSAARENMTGVLESFDFFGTVKVILDTDPEVETILLINDHTTTGVKMGRRVMELLPHIKPTVSFEFLPSMGMKELVEKLGRLDKKTAVLFLNYYVDGNNVRYGIEKSVRAITSACNRPVFSLWEHTLGYGVVGGSMAYGYDQGALAGGLGSRLLDGENASQIPLIKEHPYRYIFDHPVLARFGISRQRLPKESIVINSPRGFWQEHRKKVIAAAIIFGALLAGLLLQQRRIRSHEKRTARMQTEARLDGLTNTIVRRYFLPEVEELLKKARAGKKPLVLCYGDVNNLKYVNDTFGHQEGDHYLVAMAGIIKAFIRFSDRVYRMGGDEFMIVFLECDLVNAERRLRAIRQEIARLNRSAESRYLQGISFGCAEFDPFSPQTLQQLMEQADLNMYEEKSQKESTKQPIGS
ncbi:MAG: diguanylate cyclase [Deltaproteobacteria bacterium]|nr:diguanylate cyclase [Deltaproteobacteria bacterium]